MRTTDDDDRLPSLYEPTGSYPLRGDDLRNLLDSIELRSRERRRLRFQDMARMKALVRASEATESPGTPTSDLEPNSTPSDQAQHPENQQERTKRLNRERNARKRAKGAAE